MDSGAFDDRLPEHGGLVRLARVAGEMTVPFRRAAVSRGKAVTIAFFEPDGADIGSAQAACGLDERIEDGG